MSWGKLDDGFWCHPKIVAAGNAGAGLFARMISWSCRHNTGGRVPAAILAWLAGEDGATLVSRLLAVGLADATEDGGAEVHDFDEYNGRRAPAADGVPAVNAQAEKRRAAARERMRVRRERSRSQCEQGANANMFAANSANSSHDVRTPDANISPASNKDAGALAPVPSPVARNPESNASPIGEAGPAAAAAAPAPRESGVFPTPKPAAETASPKARGRKPKQVALPGTEAAAKVAEFNRVGALWGEFRRRWSADYGPTYVQTPQDGKMAKDVAQALWAAAGGALEGVAEGEDRPTQEEAYRGILGAAIGGYLRDPGHDRYLANHKHPLYGMLRDLTKYCAAWRLEPEALVAPMVERPAPVDAAADAQLTPEQLAAHRDTILRALAGGGVPTRGPTREVA